MKGKCCFPCSFVLRTLLTFHFTFFSLGTLSCWLERLGRLRFRKVSCFSCSFCLGNVTNVPFHFFSLGTLSSWLGWLGQLRFRKVSCFSCSFCLGNVTNVPFHFFFFRYAFFFDLNSGFYLDDLDFNW